MGVIRFRRTPHEIVGYWFYNCSIVPLPEERIRWWHIFVDSGLHLEPLNSIVCLVLIAIIMKVVFGFWPDIIVVNLYRFWIDKLVWCHGTHWTHWADWSDWAHRTDRTLQESLSFTGCIIIFIASVFFWLILSIIFLVFMVIRPLHFIGLTDLIPLNYCVAFLTLLISLLFPLFVRSNRFVDFGLFSTDRRDPRTRG